MEVNHVMKSLPHILSSKTDYVMLTPIFCFQLNHCSLDNANGYIFAHLESLIA